MNAGGEALTENPTTSATMSKGTDNTGEGLVATSDNICTMAGDNLTTVLPYARQLLPSVLALYHPHAKVKPFRQRIQLLGPQDYAVRTTAQVDNGAMRNCIGLHIWKAYGICMGKLTPTTTSVCVANNQKVRCAGTWSGKVRIGGTESYTHFLVFDC